jgi:hypothetical protein
MNDTTSNLDQTEEETLNPLTCAVSDVALEAAAGTERGLASRTATGTFTKVFPGCAVCGLHPCGETGN